ncbi:cadherin repeat domain-containing protein, partial [Photobacterium carnosum]|uniref:cadherin repeat domain-containing protein n=1 Tax=Photobacterium carnosum TaxID=2023717 RepID=UPI0018836839
DAGEGVTYRIEGENSKYFTIDGKGQISLTVDGAKSFANDYETLDNQHALDVVVSGKGEGDTTVDQHITVTLTETDVNEAPIIDTVAKDASANYAENTAAGKTLYTVAAHDVDAGEGVTYRIEGENSKYFTIDGKGQISLTVDGAKSFANDYETLDNQHALDVVVSGKGEGDTTVDQHITVTLTETDVNEAPIIDTVAKDASANYAENTAAGKTLYTVAAHDVDAGEGVTYRIEGENSKYFTIDGKGQISLTVDGAKSFANDYETLDNQHALDVVVSGEGDTTVDQHITVTLTETDVNEAPIINIEDISVNVSEEGLAHSNPDNTGYIDTTNKTVAEGSFKVTDADSTDVSVRLEGPDNITSDGKLVQFKWNEESQELNGFIGNSDHKAITITLSHDHAGDYSYHVNLMAPIDHSINNVEDIQAIKVAVITNDSEQKNVECQQTITINIEDDSPIIENGNQDVFNVVADTNIPNIISSDYFSLVSNHSDTAELRPKSGHHHHDGHFTVTAQAFVNNHNANLIDGLVSSSHDGIGVANNIDPNDVKSTYQPNGSYSKYDYDNFPLNNEVEYRHIKDNDGHLISSASEKIIITLDDNYVAYGLHIDFSQMFGGEKEVGAVEYYRNGKYLDTQSFSSDEVSGDFAKDFNYHQGGFDEIRILATDNGGKYADNSDFSIKGIQFTGNSDHDFAKGYVSGDINVKYGADGSQHIGNSALSDGLDAVIDVKNLTTITGKSIAISHDENSNTYYGVGRDDPSHHLFKFELTQSTGKWEFYQYSQINDHDNQGIKVNFTATDNDGDHAYQTIFIKPTDATTNEVHTTLLHSAENEHSLLNLDLHSESISLHHQDGKKELTHFDVNKGHLDLSDLLHNATENTIDHYLTIHQDGNDTVLSVNVDARNDVEPNIVLDNTKLGDVKANLGVITNNLLHFDGDKLILEHHSEHANSAYEPMVLPHQLIDDHNN